MFVPFYTSFVRPPRRAVYTSKEIEEEDLEATELFNFFRKGYSIKPGQPGGEIAVLYEGPFTICSLIAAKPAFT